MTTCLAINPTDPDPSFPYRCTLERGHSGDHVSDDSTGVVCATWPTDPRIAVVTHTMTTHGTAAIRAQHHPLGEHWSCKCGEPFDGPGAIVAGHVHTVEMLLAGIDAAMAVAS